MAKELSQYLPREARARRTLVGPQRDDLEIHLNGKHAATFASAGEQRRTAFVLVMAALDLAQEAGVGATVLLLDDLESEFDDDRLDRIMEYVAGRAQALIATSKVGVVSRFAATGHTLRLERGSVTSG